MTDDTHSRPALDSAPESLDVIAVGAHPDDVEIGCGGTLARLVQQGYQVGIIDLTDGEPTPGSPSPAARLAEAAEAARILGVHRETMAFENRRLFDGFDVRVELAKIFRRFRPRIVIGLEGATPMASPDHEEAAKIINAAVFYSRLSKWDETFDGLPVHPIQQQVWYSLAFASLTPPSGPSQFVVDISDTLEIKLESIRAYKTQFPPEKDRIFRLVEGQASLFGAVAGFQAGELLSGAKPLGVQNLVTALCQPPQ
ncbi:MAG: PIG-L family deacetylase [Planctomycetaceae bacterium]